MATDDPTEVNSWVRERVLGSGGFGEVTLWRNKEEDTMIALKKCRNGTDTLLTKKHKERWSKEVEIMQRLNHPNVVKAVAVPPEFSVLRSELPVMCMEYCSKGDLRQVLNRSENCCGLREWEVRCLISDVKSAVQYLHSMKITHRDLKPENIVLQKSTTRIVYKLIDLGYAKELDQSSICTSFVGTLQYLAPELFMSKSYNYSVDYWSLGLVSHEVITGTRPFLPNMTPAAWMKHVREKSSDDICAYQSQDGTIVFRQELLPENNISSCLKYHMERWLKLLLEWDASKRGRALNENKEPEIVVFRLIEEILSKKIVTLFCVPKYRYLSYEVDDSTAVSTLQRWIERDTDLPAEEQELLLPSGHLFDPDKLACQCWAEGSAVMAYVFHSRSLAPDVVTPRIPQTVEKMMAEPRNPVEYTHQKRAWAHAVYFLQQEMELYEALLQAYRVKILHLFSSNSKLGHQMAAVVSNLHQIEAQYQLCMESLSVDENHATSLQFPASVLTSWKEASSSNTAQLRKLKALVQQLQNKCDGATSKTRSTSLQMQEHSILTSLYDTGIKSYEALRRRPKESRQERTDSVEMVRVVYNCLKQRDRLLRDEKFNKNFNQVMSVQSEVDKLWDPLNKSMKVMGKVQDDLRQMQLQRQRDIWRQLAPEQCNGFTAPPVPPHLTKPQVPPHRNESVDDSSHLNPAVSTLSLADLSLPADSIQQSEAMIRDNMDLRYATQDVMNQSFRIYRQCVSETLDWSYLEGLDD